MDLPSQGAFQQSHAHPHSGEYLEVLGKHAAADWANGQHKTLTEAVTETVKQAQLSPEQVKRVVEFANTAAYLTEFKKEGTTSSVVDFHGGPADASDILKDLNDGGGGSVFDKGTLDYSVPPGETKHASSYEDAKLAAMFGETHASELPYENPHGEVIELRDKLAGAEQHLQTQISGLEVMYAELADRVYHQVKQASLEGTSLGEVMGAWETVAPSHDHIKVAFTLIAPRLLREGVFHRLDDMMASVDKTAGARVVNSEHPLVVEFDEFCTTLSKLAETREARSELQEHLRNLTAYLKYATAGGVVGKAWEGANALAGGAAKAVHPLVHSLAGETAADVASFGVKHAPKILAAGGAVELNRRVENSPSLPARGARAVKHTVLGQIPGTEDYQQRLLRMQYGQ